MIVNSACWISNLWLINESDTWYESQRSLFTAPKANANKSSDRSVFIFFSCYSGCGMCVSPKAHHHDQSNRELLCPVQWYGNIFNSLRGMNKNLRNKLAGSRRWRRQLRYNNYSKQSVHTVHPSIHGFQYLNCLLLLLMLLNTLQRYRETHSPPTAMMIFKSAWLASPRAFVVSSDDHPIINYNRVSHTADRVCPLADLHQNQKLIEWWSSCAVEYLPSLTTSDDSWWTSRELDGRDY